MKYPLTLPPCLIEAAKLLFPTLDFSRIKFYYEKNAPTPLTGTYWNRTEIVLNGTAPMWAKDPCDTQTFIILCHELVHALQGQHRLIAHRAASWTCYWVHGRGKDTQNCVEREAYDYEEQLKDWFGRAEISSPCRCVKHGVGDIAASLAITNHAFAEAVENDSSIVKQSAGCTAWDCAGPAGPVGVVLRSILAAGAMVLATAASFVDDIPSTIGAIVGGATGSAAGAIVGWSALGLVGGIAGWVIGLVVGALFVSFIVQVGAWIVSLFGDDGGALNMMFSTDGGRIFDNKVSFERSCEPMSLSFGKKTAPQGGSSLNNPDRLAVAWTGMDNQVNLMTLPLNTQEPWKNHKAFEESEDCGPAVTHIGVRLHVIWQGADSRLNGVTTTDGITLANKSTLPQTLSPNDASPAICVANGWAVMTFIGTDRHINLISSQNGIDWGRKITVFEEAEAESTVAVTATGDTGSFAMAWTGTDSDHHINLMQMHIDPTTGIITPGAKSVLNDTSATNAGPALAFANGLLCLAWTGRNGKVNFMTSRDLGATFSGKLTLSEESRSDCGPALTVKEAEGGEIPAVICIGWTGTG